MISTNKAKSSVHLPRRPFLDLDFVPAAGVFVTLAVWNRPIGAT